MNLQRKGKTMNTSYARLAKGRIEYAPSAIATPHGVTINPSRITYLAHGWKLLDLQPCAR